MLDDMWKVMKGCEGSEKPFIILNHWYAIYYSPFMKSEGLAGVSFEAGFKRMPLGA